MPSHRYPCTGPVPTTGFGAFLEAELGAPRANLRAFAQELGERFEAPQLCLVNSGSSANLAAAMAMGERLGVRPGEASGRPAVALSAGFTFPTTMSSLQTAGFRVELVDTEPGGFNLDPAALERAITPDTKLVCVTHFLGYPAALEAIVEIARAHDLLILQDGCETLDLRVPTAEGARPAHALGDLLTWSFYHPHHLSSFGGGAVVCPPGPEGERWRQLVESITHWGRACTCHYDPARCSAPAGMHHNFHYLRRGHNLEMSELNACFGRFGLRTWERDEARRKAHHATLSAALAGIEGVRVHPAPANSGSAFVFPLTLEAPRFFATSVAELCPRLDARGVEIRSLMGGVIQDQPAYAEVPDHGLERCRELARRSFFVGIHHTLEAGAVEAVASILREELSP